MEAYYMPVFSAVMHVTFIKNVGKTLFLAMNIPKKGRPLHVRQIPHSGCSISENVN